LRRSIPATQARSGGVSQGMYRKRPRPLHTVVTKPAVLARLSSGKRNRSRLRSTCTPHECGSCKRCIIFSSDDDRWKDPLARAGAIFSGAGIHDLPEQRTVEPSRQIIPRRDTDGLLIRIWNPRHHVNLVSNQSNPDNGPGAGMGICHAKDLEQFRCPLGARLER